MPLNWTIIGGQIECYEHPSDTCHVHTVQAPKSVTEFHDEILVRCTEEINEILQRVSESKEADGRELRFLTTPEGLMLAWVHCGRAVSSDSDPTDVKRALRLE